MVDIVSNISQTQSLLNRLQAQDNGQARGSEGTQRSSANPQDSVEISEEAQSLRAAEESATAVRNALENDDSLTLGLDPNFDTGV